MLTEELHAALERASEAPPFVPQYPETIRRYRRLRTRQRVLAATSVVAVLGLVAGVTAMADRRNNQSMVTTCGPARTCR